MARKGAFGMNLFDDGREIRIICSYFSTLITSMVGPMPPPDLGPQLNVGHLQRLILDVTQEVALVV
jgi:hypothetical protein